MSRTGYTDGYGWIDTDGSPIQIVADLRELDWLMKVLSETTKAKP